MATAVGLTKEQCVAYLQLIMDQIQAGDIKVEMMIDTPLIRMGPWDGNCRTYHRSANSVLEVHYTRTGDGTRAGGPQSEVGSEAAATDTEEREHAGG